ncbi:hypothetical protein CR513_02499, partial [Mucuna pruriens]
MTKNWEWLKRLTTINQNHWIIIYLVFKNLANSNQGRDHAAFKEPCIGMRDRLGYAELTVASSMNKKSWYFGSSSIDFGRNNHIQNAVRHLI